LHGLGAQTLGRKNCQVDNLVACLTKYLVLLRAGKTVLVHCVQGQIRSPVPLQQALTAI
jgi:hypothetical protein